MRRAGAIAAVVLLTACDSGVTDVHRWKQRQAAIDPPMLWRVEVLDGAAPSKPVEVCADAIIRNGFLEPMPSFDGLRCEPVGGRRATGSVRRLACEAGGRRYAVLSRTNGDPEQAFTTWFSVSPLHGPGASSQTRRYVRLGRCPSGWRIGAHTDQQGRRRPDSRW